MQWIFYLLAAAFGFNGFSLAFISPHADGDMSGRRIQLHGISARVMGIFSLITAVCLIRCGMLLEANEMEAIIPWFFGGLFAFMGGGMISAAINKRWPAPPDDDDRPWGVPPHPPVDDNSKHG